MEMLFSMFPNKGEISLQDKNALSYVQMYLKNIKEGLPPRIEYSISVDIDEPKGNLVSSVWKGSKKTVRSSGMLLDILTGNTFPANMLRVWKLKEMGISFISFILLKIYSSRHMVIMD